MKWQINVSAPVLKRNRDLGTDDPAIIVRDCSGGLGNPYTMAREVIITGPSKLCNGSGQSIWIETDGPLELLGAVTGLDQ
jgi:hypothetical protein